MVGDDGRVDTWLNRMLAGGVALGLLASCDTMAPDEYSPKDVDDDGQYEMMIEDYGSNLTVAVRNGDETYETVVDGIKGVAKQDKDLYGITTGDELVKISYEDGSYTTDVVEVDSTEREELALEKDDLMKGNVPVEKY